MHRRLASSRTGALVVAVAASALLASRAPADAFTWNNPAGGFFADPANWNDGASGLPGPEDVLLFAQDAAYDVLLAEDAALQHVQLVLRRGELALRFLDAGIPAELAGGGAALPALVIADEPDTPARLELLTLAGSSQRFDVASARLGAALGAHGTWTHADDRRRIVAGTVDVGWIGLGTLACRDGARFEATQLAAGTGIGAIGTLLVEGAGTRLVAEEIALGVAGDGALTVLDGALVATGDLALGRIDGALGTATATGAGTTIEIAGILDVGWWGDGVLLLDEGAALTVLGTATVGGLRDPFTLEWAHGAIELGRDALLFASGDLLLGLGGEATLTCRDGGAAWVTGDLDSWSTGERAGTLAVLLDDAATYAGAPAVFCAGSAAIPRVEIALAAGHAPQVGDAHVLVRALGGVTADELALPALPGARFVIDDDGTELRARVVAAADLDADGTVGFADLLALLAAWGACPPPPDRCLADLDGDGVVGFTDLLLVLADWSAP